MIKYPSISVVLVNKNGAKYLEACLRSIIQQEYPALELIVMDGGSTDGSVEIIQRYESHISFWTSEPDEGQYHAVQKGFERSKGDILCWMNSDDLYLPGAFQTVGRLFQQFPDVEWLMGFPGEFDDSGTLIRRIGISWARWSQSRYLTFDFQFIQQESCFWTRELWERAGSKVSTDYALAGDLELWTRFFRHARLHTTIASLAGFRQHSSEQRSVAQRQAYLDECHQILRKERNYYGPFDRFRLQLLRVCGLVLGPLFFFEVPILRHAYRWLFRIPALINYDVEQHTYYRGEKLVKLPPLFVAGRSIHRKSFKST